VRLASLGFFAVLFALPSVAAADRLAVIALDAPGHPTPVLEADQLGADLIARGHRVIAGADAVARISTGNQGAGPDWAAQILQSIGASRAALTRLDRAFASNITRQVGEDLVRRGGGAGGAEVLVEWCLLERQLALTASDSAGAKRWLDAAVAYGPDVELDPLRHPEDERDLFARRRAALRSESASTLSITTTPPAAEVWIDGVRRCESPCSVTLVPGRHLARASTPAHAPAIIDFELGPGASLSRRVGLTAAYSGASLQAISAMLADPSRRSEGAAALEPMARFLDVDHVIAIVPEGSELRVLVAPPASGRARMGTAVQAGLPAAVSEQLIPTTPPEGSEPSKPWYAKTGTWLVGAGLVTGAVVGVLVLGSKNQTPKGTITVRSP
jgi:hypothetical protein